MGKTDEQFTADLQSGRHAFSDISNRTWLYWHFNLLSGGYLGFSRDIFFSTQPPVLLLRSGNHSTKWCGIERYFHFAEREAILRPLALAERSHNLLVGHASGSHL